MSWALTPAQEEAIRAAAAGGASRRALAEAYGVHKRTIYRVLLRERKHYPVTVGEYAAVFEVRADGPIRITPWVPA